MTAPPEARFDGPGFLRASDIPQKSRYELHDGHPIYCAPTGAQGARRTISGAEVLDSDPTVSEAGIDAGFSPSPGMLRAPDVAVGNVPDQKGWIEGVPPLAVEYAGTGQDETGLQEKIQDFLKAGSRFVWVVRLVGPQRIEVYEQGKAVRTAGPGDELSAPGILRNSYPVEAFFDRATAHQLTLRNLLQREGYESLDQIRAEGHQQGREKGLEEGLEKGLEEGLRAAIRDLCEAFGIALSTERNAAITAMRAAELDELRARLKRDRGWE